MKMSAFKISTLLFILTVVANSHLIKRGYRVLNGDNVNDWKSSKFKFIVMISGSVLCTASLLDKNTIVTAGHCFKLPTSKPNYINLEFTKTKGPINKSIWIKESFVLPAFKPHSGQNAPTGNDLGVGKLSLSVNKKTHDQVTLNFLAKGKPAMGTEIYFAGYGDVVTAQLRFGQSSIQQCINIHPGNPICVQPELWYLDQETQPGDSGAPAFVEYKNQWIGVGVLSGLMEYMSGDKEMLFTATGLYYDFLKKHAG